jgi:hypothetical protein
MDDQERRHIEELIGLYTRRLHILEKQIASAGIRTPPEIQIECEDVKRKLEELKGQTEHSSVVTVELITHGSSGLESGATERIDWTALFDGGLPSADAWSEQLLPELYRLKARIVQGGGQVIALRAKAHLSAGLAFGYVFRAPTGYRLWVEQSDLHTRQAQWWRTDEKPLLETPLEQERTAGPSRAKNTETSVEISAASDVDIRAAVRQSILQHKLPIRERIHLPSAAVARQGCRCAERAARACDGAPDPRGDPGGAQRQSAADHPPVWRDAVWHGCSAGRAAQRLRAGAVL